MDITISKTDAAIQAKIVGAITEADSDPLRSAFDAMATEDIPTVNLDLSMVPIITSTGIGKLIVFFKRLKSQNRELVISGIHDSLFELFSSINLDKMLNIVRK